MLWRGSISEGVFMFKPFVFKFGLPLFAVILSSFSLLAAEQDLTSFIHKKIALESKLFEQWGIYVDGYEGPEDSLLLGSYVEFLEDLSSRVVERKYQARDASESYKLVWSPQLREKIETQRREIYLSGDVASIDQVLSFFESLSPGRTLSASALIENIRAFVKEGEDVRVYVEDSKGVRKEIRFEATKNLRWKRVR